VDVLLWIELILFVILMGFSGFFSSSETALFSLNRLQLEQMRRDENPRIGLIEHLLSEPRRLIVTILIGNEFVNVAASVISAAIVISLLGAEHKLVNLFIMIPILLLVGEITPKTLAIRNNVAFATFQSRPIELFATLITPLRWVVRMVADWITTLLVGNERTRGSIVTEDMVRVLAHEAVGEGVLDKHEAQYIDHIFDFGNKTVEDIMTPRSNIFFLPIDLPLQETVEALRKTRRTKVPIYQGHRDSVLGFLYARDLLGVDIPAVGIQAGWLRKRLREPYFVPESKPVSDLFHAFRKRKLSVALTVDEYGGVTGLVSMEDLLECIFGELPSASDTLAEPAYLELPDGSSRLEGSMPVEQFNLQFGTRLDETVAETIGGLLLHAYGELPPEEARIELKGIEFQVKSVTMNRIEEVTVRRLSPPPAPPVTSQAEESAPTGAAAEGEGVKKEATPAKTPEER
jgi:putative hemolysin